MQEGVVLIPTYNERENIAALIPMVLASSPLRIMVIDDNSPDGTGRYVESLLSSNPRVSLLSRARKEGLGAAYKHGISEALVKDMDPIIFMDADGSHGIEALPEFLEKSREYDLVVGSRYIPGGRVERWEWWRYLLSRCGNVYARFLTGLQIHDITSGFICVRSALLRGIDLSRVEASGYAFQIDLKFRLIVSGARVTEIPIVFHARREGESKMSHHIILEGLRTPLKLCLERILKR